MAALRVIEGYVDRLILSGDIGGDTALLQSLGQKIVDSRPLKAAVLERYLLLLQDLSGVTARAILRPSKSAPGASDLVLLMGHDFVDASIQADNLGTRFVGPSQTVASLGVNSAFGLYETAGLQLALTPDSNELRMAGLNLSLPIGTEGTRVTVSAAKLRSKPGSFLEALELRGDSVTARALLLHPIIRGRVQNLNFLLTFDLLNSTSKAFDSMLSEDRLRSLRAGAFYDLVDPWFGFNSVSLEASRGLEVLGARGSEAPDQSRADGRGDYEKLVLDLTRLQDLGGGWSLLARARGQYARVPLLAPEEFGIGGGEFGRAYAAAEIIGDHGAAGSLELRLSGNDPESSIGWQMYGFYDIGAVWQQAQDGTESAPRQSAASAGLGTRLFYVGRITGGIEVAKPLTRAPTTDRDDREKGFVVNLRLQATF